MNPYEPAKRGGDTLALVVAERVQFRLAGDGTVAPFQRRWRVVDGHVGWHAEMLRYVNLYLDAGMIDYPRPAGRDVDEFDPELMGWTPVSLTHAGEYLLRSWRERPQGQHQSVICHYPDVGRTDKPSPFETVRFGPFTSAREKEEWARANLPARSFHFCTLWRPDQLEQALRSYRADHPQQGASR